MLPLEGATMKKIILFLKIVWRKWDTAECNLGHKHTYRIDIKTAWETAKIVHG